MNVPEAIEFLLNRMNTRKQFVAGTFAALGGTAGSLQMLQKDANAAIVQYRDEGKVDGLKQFTNTLHLYGHLSDAEYQQVMETLDGEN
jgi:hypothetical protein